MTLDELLDIVVQIPARESVTLTPSQRDVLDVAWGPLWVIAGPGSGKTEVLVLRCLRLMYVDRVNPRSILVTTFTEKAARELQDRITDYAAWVTHMAPPGEANDVDVTHVRVGTLHSLCNDIMHEYRYPPYQNVRLMDELEQLIFINEYSPLVIEQPINGSDAWQLWSMFVGLLRDWPNQSANMVIRNRLNRAKGMRNLVSRIVEYRVNVDRMREAGEAWACLADGYDEYVKQLGLLRRSDFSHVQATFLQFLDDPKGQFFLNGDGSPDHPGIIHVLVDEYQDTNPVQEAIYLRMAQAPPHNLMVVGDDDQAIYRFRGGTIDCLINFNHSCGNAWGIPSDSIQPFPLYDNFRSHQRIVTWCNHYITVFPTMQRPEVRAPGKLELSARSSINDRYGDYPAVGIISGPQVTDIARVFALTVRELLDEGCVSDPSDCALMMRSTRETKHWAKPYVEALASQGIRAYNPRSKAFLDQPEIRTALGTFLAVVDPDLGACPPVLRDTVQKWDDARVANISPSTPLADYVTQAQAQIASKGPGTLLNVGALELLHILLSFPPFSTWKQDTERSYRLAKLTRILECYIAMPLPYDRERTRAWLASSSQGFQVSWRWRQSFYWGLLAILRREGLDDEEDEYILFPPGRLPIMTIFQAKGLQFPFVFVATRGDDAPQPSGTHDAEDLLYPFRDGTLAQQSSAAERAIQDFARLFYVAHSRAQYGLVLLATHGQRDGDAVHLGPRGAQWISDHGGLDITLLPVIS